MTPIERKRQRQNAWYRRKHNVPPTRYRTAERRLFCKECWKALTRETAVRVQSRGRVSRLAWCTECYRPHRRLLWRAQWAARRERGWKRASEAAA